MIKAYREVTDADIGKMIEVTDQRPTVEGVVWMVRKLLGIEADSCFPFLIFPGSRWKYARIEVNDNQSSSSPNLLEHQLVQLREAMPEQGLLQGQSGTIVHLYADGLLCEVEFISPDGSKVVTLQPIQIEPSK